MAKERGIRSGRFSYERKFFCPFPSPFCFKSETPQAKLQEREASSCTLESGFLCCPAPGWRCFFFSPPGEAGSPSYPVLFRKSVGVAALQDRAPVAVRVCAPRLYVLPFPSPCCC